MTHLIEKDKATNPVEVGFFGANAIATQAYIAAYTLDKGAGHVNTIYCRDSCIYRQYIGFVLGILRVIILVLARYYGPVFLNSIKINNLELWSGGYGAKEKWNMAHARLAREGVMYV